MAFARRLRTSLVMVVAGASLALGAPVPASAEAPTLTLAGPLTPAVTYEGILFEGQVSPAGGLSRVIFQQQVPGGWHDLSGWRPDNDGSFDMPFTTYQRGTYHLRLRSPGGSVISNVIDVTVAPHPTEIMASASTGGHDIIVGQRVWVSGNVVEPTATPRVVVQRRVNGKWSDRQAGVVDAKGRFSIAIAPSQVGHYELRVRSNGGSRWSLYPIEFDVSPRPIP
jgi:hypothetical protein